MRDSKHLPVFIFYFISFFFIVSRRQALRIYYCVKKKRRNMFLQYAFPISFCPVNNLESFLFGDAVVKAVQRP